MTAASILPANRLPDPTAIQRAIGEACYVWVLDDDTLAWGANAAEVLGVESLSLIASGRGYARLLTSDSQATRFDAVMRAPVRDPGAGVPYQIEYALTPAPGVKVWVEDTGRWYAGADGRPQTAQGVIRVINDRRERDERLTYLSRYDSLTGEMNRQALLEELAAALDDAVRYRSSCGFLIVAVDSLARINNAYGYEVADDAIAAVGRRLRTRMRAPDSLGRFSGNKFGVVLKTATPEDIAAAADRFLAVVREQVVSTRTGPVAVTISIGGVAAPRHAQTLDEIISRAQESLEQAKRRRRGSFAAYRPSVERDAERRENVRATDEIVSALNEHRLILGYEPVADARTRAVAFHECLVRIRTEEGIVGAGSIVPMAERLGLVRLIDRRVLDLVLDDLHAMPQLHASLNVSPASTLDPDWWGALDAQMRRNRALGSRLTLEITEMAAIADLDDARGFVARAKEFGCRIAIDDFGAGYTSFRNLRGLGVDIIKVDGSFVRNLTHSADDRIFVRAMIELAKSLGLSTVAEWVQDEEAAALLCEWGCDFLQGNLVGPASLERPYESIAKAPPPLAGYAQASR